MEETRPPVVRTVCITTDEGSMVIPGYQLLPEVVDLPRQDDPVWELSLGFWCQYALTFVSLYGGSTERWEEYGPTD